MMKVWHDGEVWNVVIDWSGEGDVIGWGPRLIPLLVQVPRQVVLALWESVR